MVEVDPNVEQDQVSKHEVDIARVEWFIMSLSKLLFLSRILLLNPLRLHLVHLVALLNLIVFFLGISFVGLMIALTILQLIHQLLT